MQNGAAAEAAPIKVETRYAHMPAQPPSPV